MEKQRWEESEKRREDERRSEKRKSQRRKKMQVREKVGKSRNTWFVAPEGRKVGSLKWRVQSHLARWEMKNRAKHIRKSKCAKHLMFGRLLKLRCRKSARRYGAKHVWKSKCTKHTILGPLLEVEMSRCGAKHMWKSECTKHTSSGPLLEVDMSKKCTPLWREAHFEVNMLKAPTCSDNFWKLRCRFAWHAQGIRTLSKVSKTWGFCSISKNDSRRGTFEEDLQRCIFHGRRNTRDMFIRAVRRSGRWFPERVAFWSLRSSGLPRWFCVAGAALRVTWHHFFVAGAVL